MEGTFFLIGIVIGLVFGIIVKPDVPATFDCTETAIKKGDAICITYEMKQEFRK
jgi:galactitol-specific phosphotransferase system IIC component